jgi:hypothetical protein
LPAFSVCLPKSPSAAPWRSSHPFLAWDLLSARGRICLTGAYLAAGYVAVLSTLLLVG